MSLSRQSLSLFGGLLALAALPAAQGHVLTVDDGPNACGGAWLFELHADGSFESQLELSDLAGNIGGFSADGLSDQDAFGKSVAPLGDLNGDGVQDLAVGVPFDDRRGWGAGSVSLLFRAPDGSVASRVALRPGLSFPPLGLGFGSALANLGDLDGDGTLELAVGEPEWGYINASGTGKVRIVSLAADGSVAREVVIGPASGGFGGQLDTFDVFGDALAALGDLDGDGVNDLAVGAWLDDDGASQAGAVWVLFLNPDGTVKAEQKISSTSGGFGGALDFSFGASIAPIGDLDGDGVTEIAVGEPFGGVSGSVWVLFLNPDGTVKAEQQINETVGGLGNHADEYFGSSAAPLGDLDSDGNPDLAVGAQGGTTGAVFVLFLNADGTVKSRRRYGSEFGNAENGDQLGVSLANLGDWDLDGRPDLAVGATNRAGAPNQADFTNLPAAVAAAASGDTILIRGGGYNLGGAVVIDGKSLTIQAEHPRSVDLGGTIRIRNLTASQSVQLSGLYIDQDGSQLLPPLLLENNAGRVWLEDCFVRTGEEEPNSYEHCGPGLKVDACAAVILTRCQIGGANGYEANNFDVNAPTPAGVELGGGSSVHAYDCDFTGANGGFGGFPATYQEGGPGLHSLSSGDVVFLSGCHVRGGRGNLFAGCEAGGVGLEAAGTVRALDSTFTGGSGCPAGAATIGAVQVLAGEHLAMVIDDPTRVNEGTAFSFEGPPDAAVYVQSSLLDGARYRPLLSGVDLLGTQRFLRYIGRTDASGRLQSREHLGPVPFEVLRFFAQALCIQPSAPVWTHKVSPVPREVLLGTGAVIVRFPQF